MYVRTCGGYTDTINGIEGLQVDLDMTPSHSGGIYEQCVHSTHTFSLVLLFPMPSSGSKRAFTVCEIGGVFFCCCLLLGDCLRRCKAGSLVTARSIELNPAVSLHK